MAQNPFGRVRPGVPMEGIPAVVWNAILDLIEGKLDAARKDRFRTSTEIGVLNSSGSALTTRFQILQVGNPVPLQSVNDSEFAESRVLVGTTPAAAAPFAVLMEPLTTNTIGRATLLGMTPVQINVTDAAHTYADATTDPTKLTSAASGPARILWKETGTGTKWAVVNLLGAAPASSSAAAWRSTWPQYFSPGPFTGEVIATDVLGAPSVGLYSVVGVLYYQTSGPAMNVIYTLQIGSSGTATIHSPNPIYGLTAWDDITGTGPGIIPISQFVTVTSVPCFLSIRVTASNFFWVTFPNANGAVSIAGPM